MQDADKVGSDVSEARSAPAIGERKESPSNKVRKSGSGMFRDPLVRGLAWFGAILMIAYLATVVGVLLFGRMDGRVPRTSVEQRLMTNRAAVEAGSTDSAVWRAYVEALVADGQYSRAQTIIDRAVEAEYEDPMQRHLSVAQVYVDLGKEDYESAIKQTDAALLALEGELKKALEQFEKDNKPTELTAQGLPDTYYLLLQLKAQAQAELGQNKEAIETLDKYLEEYPRAADVLVWRGDLKVLVNDTEGAVADYHEAERYMPGEEELQQKIDSIGANQ